MSGTVSLHCCAAALLAALTLPAAAQTATRYSTPPAVALSSDLAAPWINQLSNKPAEQGRRSLTLAPVRKAIPAGRQMQPGIAPVETSEPRKQRNMRTGVQQASAPAKKPEQEFDPQFEMQMVEYDGAYSPGTIIIDTEARFLYLVEEPGKARRYGVGVGRPGFEWAGEHKVTRKAEWPGWTPPEEMREREAAKGKILPQHMEGGPENPLGARALYLGDSMYRIHGTNQPWSIGKAVSSGCIRMRNEDVIDLYERVGVGTKVIVS
jgi:lipoprotein-anchoring transpeptidase ErfK/SrfK